MFNIAIVFILFIFETSGQSYTFTDTYPCTWDELLTIDRSAIFECLNIPIDGSARIYLDVSVAELELWSLSLAPTGYYCEGDSICSYIRQTYIPSERNATIMVFTYEMINADIHFSIDDNGESEKTPTILSDIFPCAWNQAIYLTSTYIFVCKELPDNSYGFPFDVYIDLSTSDEGLFSIQASSNIEPIAYNRMCSSTTPCNLFRVDSMIIIESGSNASITLRNEQYDPTYTEVQVIFSIQGGPPLNSISTSSRVVVNFWFVLIISLYQILISKNV